MLAQVYIEQHLKAYTDQHYSVKCGLCKVRITYTVCRGQQAKKVQQAHLRSSEL